MTHMLMVAGYTDQQQRESMINDYCLNTYQYVRGGVKQGKFVSFADALKLCGILRPCLPRLEAVFHHLAQGETAVIIALNE